MEWSHVSSEKELRALGSFKVVKEQVKESVEPLVQIKCRGWKGLYEQIQLIQKLSQQVFNDQVKEVTELKDSQSHQEFSLDIEYFKSNADQYIFYLVELDGKTQATKLGISKLMYHNADLAKKWYRQIAKIIHPDITKHPKSEEAMSVLNDIYKKMMPDG